MRSQVRLNVLAKLEALGAVINVKTLAGSLLPALSELGRDRAWRVRLATIDFFAGVAKALGPEPWAPGSEAVELALSWLKDQTFAIREAGALNLARLAEVLGPAWADRALLPRVRPQTPRRAPVARLGLLRLLLLGVALIALGRLC